MTGVGTPYEASSVFLRGDRIVLVTEYKHIVKSIILHERYGLDTVRILLRYSLYDIISG